MKKYILEVVITEGNDEFWESLDGKTGCDEVVEGFIDALSGTGWDFNSEIKLIKYTDE
jgi:hypothetical protein